MTKRGSNSSVNCKLSASGAPRKLVPNHERGFMKVMLGVHARGGMYDSLLINKTLPELDGMYQWDEIVRADSGHTPYNRAASRNVLAAEAARKGFDVVVIADADSIPEPENLKLAIEGAYTDGRMHVPFDTVRVIGSRHSQTPGTAYKRARPIYTYGPSCGGIFVIQPKRWIYAGGMDERIVGWGYEDQIFLVAIKTFLGDPVYHPGNLYNFTHPRSVEKSAEGANCLLRDRYNKYVGNQPEIRLLQLGSNRWTGLKCPN